MIGLALAAVYLIWGSTYFAIRVAIGSMPPFLMAGTRFLVAGSILYTIRRVGGWPRPERKQLLSASAVGVLLLLGGNGGVVYAELTIGSGLVALIVATVPLFVGLFGGLFGRWPSGREWLGIAVGLVGIALLSLDGSLRATPVGLVIVMLGTMSWAFGSMWSKKLPMPGGLDAAGVEMMAGGAAMLIVGLCRGEHVHVPTVKSLIAFAYLIVFGSLIGFTAYIFLLEHTRPAVSTSYAYVNPVVAMGIGAAFGEHVRPIHLAALGIVLGGVALMARSTPTRR